MQVCAACGQESPEGFRFCGACGAELAAAQPAREQRKTVTLLFCDVTGSTALGEELDPESMRRTMGRYFEEIRRIVERHGGTVEKFIGDAVMAVFGIPLVHEDDALRAVRAAVEIRDRIGSLGDELGVALSFRTGVNTGEVVAGEGETLVTGDAVNVAARLEQAAAPGEVLIGGGTLALVRDAVEVEAVEPLELKGKREPFAAYRLVTVDPTAEAFARRTDAPLVGRVRERGRLRSDFEHAVSERACHMFTLLGPAGVGKSRLVAEFLAEAGEEADVLHARCLHYGEDITYWPLVEILIAIGVDPETVIRASPADTQLIFRRLLEARAAERPQIVLLDDIQWAEEVFLDLIEHIADWSRDAPIFLLCVARPELLEVRPGWGGGKLNATTILLEPLSADDCDLLIDELVGDVVLEPDVRRRILAAADGNPLFLEEMLAMVAEDGGAGEIVVPPTIQALLQARLDRLGVEERDVIGRGSVEGQVFHRGVVQELAAAADRDGVPTHLLTLVRKDVIRPEQATFSNDDAFRFRHLLIRDAAYDALPKETRADLHERFADWLERHGDLVELDEIAGYHLAQAHANRAALDATDSRLAGLARHAAMRLGAAGRGAMNRRDVAAACGLLARAAALLPQGDPLRTDLRIESAFPSTLAGLPVVGIISELEAADTPRSRAFADILTVWIDHALGTPERLERCRQAMLALDDDLGLAWVEMETFAISWSALQAEAGRSALDRAVAHATEAGQPALVEYLRGWVGATMTFGPTPAEEVIAAAEKALETASGPLELGAAQRRLGRMLACRGDFERARDVYQAGLDIARDAGDVRQAAAGVMGLSYILRRAGEGEAAETALRMGVEELEAMGDRGFYSTLVAELATLLTERGAYDEAAVWCARARETTIANDLATLVEVEAVEGRLAAARGDCTEAERLGRNAVRMLAGSDFYEHIAGFRLELARTLSECGKPEEARELAAEALRIYEAKGDRPAAGWARELLESLG